MAEFIFSVDSALLKELGEKLVSSVHVALTELVKNAYDADAREVTIEILPQTFGGPRITISDNGHGMTTDEVRKFWMKIGTANKQFDQFSRRFGRRKTGAKGVGRFACRRLGAKLKLTTTATYPKPPSETAKFQQTSVLFNWDDFKAGTDVDSVECKGKTVNLEEASVGTVLEISGAPENEWTEGGFNYLKRQLGILASNTGAKRPRFEVDPGFNLLYQAPGISGDVTDLRSEVIDATWGTLIASVDNDGRAHCSLSAKGLGPTKHYKSGPRFKLILGASLKLGIMPLEKTDFRKPQILSKYAAQSISNEWGGVQVRYNGFRMFPYGDPGDDWLGIDADRGRRLGKPQDAELLHFARSIEGIDASRTLLNMLSMRSYIGSVDATSEIPNLEPRIDRQGFVANSVFTQLVQFVRFTIDWANIHRDFYVQSKVVETADQAREAIKHIVSREIPREQLVPKVASYLRQEIRKIVNYLPEEEQQQTQQILFKTIRAIETSSEVTQRQIEHLRLIASASTLTLLFAHEIRTFVGTLSAAAARLTQIADRLKPPDSESLAQVSAQLKEARSRFGNLIEMTGIVGAFEKQPLMDRVHLKAAVEKSVRCFRLVIDSYRIDVDFKSIPGDITVGPMIEGELYTVLINILSNAIKSVIAAGRDSRDIRVTAKRQGNRVTTDIYDKGIGLSTESFEEVFKPFISDPEGRLYDGLEHEANPEDAHVFGTGSGLGLAIVRDIVTARKGTVKFVEPPTGWSTHVQLTLP